MAESEGDLRSLLRFPRVYRAFQQMLGGDRIKQTFLKEYVRPNQGDAILDVGCGPADLLAFMPKVRYVGFDINPKYISSARARFKDRGQFLQLDAAEDNLDALGKFDIAIACAVIHHLDDDATDSLFNKISSVLQPGGRFVTLDCCYTPNQGVITKMLLHLDRGQNIRTPDGYRTLAESHFANVEIHLREDLLRMPYTHIIMQLWK